jgi:hypothetical protein
MVLFSSTPKSYAHRDARGRIEPWCTCPTFSVRPRRAWPALATSVPAKRSSPRCLTGCSCLEFERIVALAVFFTESMMSSQGCNRSAVRSICCRRENAAARPPPRAVGATRWGGFRAGVTSTARSMICSLTPAFRSTSWKHLLIRPAAAKRSGPSLPNQKAYLPPARGPWPRTGLLVVQRRLLSA